MTLESAMKCWDACKADEGLRNVLLSLDQEGRKAKVEEMGYDFTLGEMMEVISSR